jgi:hypothetical protein
MVGYLSDEIGRVKGLLEFERIEGVSDSMRELIEDLWPELVHRLPLKKPQAEKCRPRPRTRPRS